MYTAGTVARRRSSRSARTPRVISPLALADLVRLNDRQAELRDELRRMVDALRAAGATDRAMAAALGVSQQAVSKRWPRGGAAERGS